MGITGELVRSVFSKSHSVGTHDSNVKNNTVEKRRWSSVRSYLCGDEFNSVLAEEDSGSVRSSKANITQHEFCSALTEEDKVSVKSSEATVTQPILEDFSDKGDTKRNNTKQKIQEERENSTAKLFQEEDAVYVIQSTFRSFLARRRGERIKLMNDKQELVAGTGSSSGVSIGTSIEVQTANSTEAFSLLEESISVPHRMHLRSKTQVLKLEEDWDDSTVSSSISKMRIRNRLEAATKRERALAYAFSQQLRICSKKKQTRSDGEEPNMGWSWLERWMATRQQDSFFIESEISKQIEPNIKQGSVVRKRLFDVAKEEKESCGSNEVSVQLDNISVITADDKCEVKPSKNGLKTSRSLPRQRTLPSCHYTKEHIKVRSKKDCAMDNEIAKKQKTKQAASKREIKYKEAT